MSILHNPSPPHHFSGGGKFLCTIDLFVLHKSLLVHLLLYYKWEFLKTLHYCLKPYACIWRLTYCYWYLIGPFWRCYCPTCNSYILIVRPYKLLPSLGVSSPINVNISHFYHLLCNYSANWNKTLQVVWLMVFGATFNNISVISWWSVLLVEETGVPGENHRPVAIHCQTWSHNVVSSIPRHERGSNSQL